MSGTSEETPWATYRLVDFMHAEIDNPNNGEQLVQDFNRKINVQP